MATIVAISVQRVKAILIQLVPVPGDGGDVLYEDPAVDRLHKFLFFLGLHVYV